MKKLLTIIASLVLATSLTSFAESSALKKIAPPTAGSSQPEIYLRAEDQVIGYWVPLTKSKDWGSAHFTAKTDGKLLGIRLVISDHTDYEWDCQYDNAGHLIMDGNENGVHSDNTVTIDRMAWMKFFREKVALKSFEYIPAHCTQTEVEKERDGIWYTNGGVITGNGRVSAVVKPIGSQYVETIPAEKFLFDLPKDGEKFLLGRKNGKYVPLRQTATGEYYIPVSDDMPKAQLLKGFGMAQDGKLQ